MTNNGIRSFALNFCGENINSGRFHEQFQSGACAFRNQEFARSARENADRRRHHAARFPPGASRIDLDPNARGERPESTIDICSLPSTLHPHQVAKTRQASIRGCSFLATALNTIVAAVLAVLITLGVVRQQDVAESDQSRARQPAARVKSAIAQERDVAAAVAGTIAMVGEPVPATPVIRSVELLPIGSRERPRCVSRLAPLRDFR